MAETVLVTGGTGFVAGWVIVELLKRGYDVRTTVRDLGKADAVRAAVRTQVEPGGRLTFAVADLTDDAGWDAAVAGCAHVLHVASPLGRGEPTDATLIPPARDGTLRVLRAAVAGGVKRVVMTSSTAACAPRLQGPDSFSDETLWTDLGDPDGTPYRRSKIVAERAAWDFMAANGGATGFVTVLPSAIFGPVLTADNPGSVMVVGRLFGGTMPGVPKVGFSVVDVRDLADAHIRAMTTPEAAGQRFIACSEYLTMAEMARALRAGLPEPFASRTPKRTLPSFLVRLAARRDPALRGIVPTLGRRHAFNSAKAQRLLGWRPRPARETVVETAKRLIEVGAVS
ncbi:aldehyde reductase [Phenylobacterium sp.]|uniref:SDR family oxidoreductase n=1 Tax=Phenylobacterium sp. TaxID=1871053 RepID=UPI0025D3C8A1|nr:aldehyde reductase [Phenylobacterium sp.]MBX3482130.1 aldehyde reductase [Phenylobacterium sp.]MCW5760819.1 aldehyde reductase [Phenylobacterium sp.]